MIFRNSYEQPKHLADANFSKDMSATLLEYFDQYAIEGVVTVEVTDKGLWLKNPTMGRQFLGATDLIKLRPVN